MASTQKVGEGYDLNEYPAYTSFIYGEQTWGPLFSQGDGPPIPFTDNSAAVYIQESLKVLRMAPEDLRGKSVLNIGSGREAAIFQKLGAGRVTHLDISKRSVENTQRYAKQMGIANLVGVHADIQTADQPAEQFDLIFLAGIYQHIHCPAKALLNLARMMRTGGKMYLGFFRSGEWKYFIVDAIRHLISRDLFAVTKSKIALSLSFGQGTHYQMTRTLDDLFVPCQHKFHPRDVIHDAERVGLGIFHFDNDLREYAHEGSGYFSIGGDRIYLVKERTPARPTELSEMKTEQGRHQLRDVPYQEEIILSNIHLIEKLRAMVDHGVIPRDDLATLALNLYRFTRPFAPEQDEYYQRSIRNGRHRTLHEYLTNVISYFE